jgi:hypothetical protein
MSSSIGWMPGRAPSGQSVAISAGFGVREYWCRIALKAQTKVLKSRSYIFRHPDDGCAQEFKFLNSLGEANEAPAIRDLP